MPKAEAQKHCVVGAALPHSGATGIQAENKQIRRTARLKTSASSRASVRRVAIASLIGTTIEWYDFFLYGTASALIFGRLFFPNYDPLTGTLASFGTYAVGFIARPIGGIVCGHFGDRIGRRSMLVLTLLIMGIATFLIGLLPTYQSIGIRAPVLLVLLRVAQGFGVGGEWGGAVLMAVEHAPGHRRGFYGSWPQVGVPAGLLSTVVFGLISRLPAEILFTWGWRVAFLLSLLLVAVGLYSRRLCWTKMPEGASGSSQMSARLCVSFQLSAAGLIGTTAHPAAASSCELFTLIRAACGPLARTQDEASAEFCRFAVPVGLFSRMQSSHPVSSKR